MERVFTTHLTAYSISKIEKICKKTLLDIISETPSYSSIILMIMMDCKGLTDEQAGQKIDKYQSEGHGFFDLYFQVLSEIDADTHILKEAGASIEELKKQFNIEINSNNKNENNVIDFKAPEKNNENALKPNETPKVDVNGFVSLDNESMNF